MSWSNQQTRRLLASLDRPQSLQRCALGAQLKEALGAESIRDAILWIVNKTFEEPTRHNALLRDVILLCDVKGEKGTHVASMLNVSTRTFFRLRADAIAMLTHNVEHILNHPEPHTDFKYEITRMISPVKPEMAAHLLEREANRMGSRAAYEAVCASARNGRDVPASLLNKCTGHWRPLAELEVARTNLIHGSPERYQEMRPAILHALESLSGTSRERVEFELAYVDRLDAIRRCDVEDSADATRRLGRAAGADLRLRALACVCQAEQACDEADLDTAEMLLRELQAMCLRLNDFRISARTSHVSSILSLLKSSYAETRDLCEVTIAALGHVEPEFAACAAALAGRAQLLLGHQWERPQELCERFPQSYVTGLVDSVWARHLAVVDPNLALPVAEASVAMAASRDARGALAYAQGTLAIVYELQGRRVEAQRQGVAAWEYGVALRRPFYLYDLLVHPALPSRDIGALELDEDLLAAMSRRFARLQAGSSEKLQPQSTRLVILKCLNAALEQRERERRPVLRRPHAGEATLELRRTGPFEHQAVAVGLQQLAVDIAYCLPPEKRQAFILTFEAAASDLFGALPA